MTDSLSSKTIAILATHGVEETELLEARRTLLDAGAHVHVIAPEPGDIRAWTRAGWGETVAVDKTLDEARANDYDGVVLPGGPLNVDALRTDKRAIQFIHDCHDAKETLGAIGHAPALLSEAGVVDGRELTSAPSLASDLRNGGAIWVNAVDVTDEGIVTSGGPEDVPAFCAKFVAEMQRAPHVRRGRPGHRWMRRPLRPDPEVEGARSDPEEHR